MGYTELTEKSHLFEQGLRGDHILGKLGKCLYTCKNREAAANCGSLPFCLLGYIPKPLMDRRIVMRLRTVPALIFPLSDAHKFLFPPYPDYSRKPRR